MQLRPWILAAALALPLTPAVLAQPAEPATTKSARGVQDVLRDIQSCSKDLATVATSPRDLLDPARRTEMGPKALPILNRFEGLMQELAGLPDVPPQTKAEIAIRRYDLLSMKALLGDTAAETSLKQAAESKDTTTADASKAALLTVDWVRTAQDAAAQSKVLDRTEELAKANPSDKSVALLLVKYVQFGYASPDNRARAVKIINEDLQGPLAEQIKSQLAKATTQPAGSTPPKSAR